MRDSRRKLLGLLVLVLVVAIIGVQALTDPDTRKLVAAGAPKGGGSPQELMVQLPGQFIVATFAGFREVIAGTLWVRADDFFHKGEYQAIIPIVRLVSWLDPHNVDVYMTGAWHLDYNFVDDMQRSDKRYIPAAIALLEEGIANNPDRWDLYFELGWTHYSKKLEDYAKAAQYIKLACERPGVDANTGARIGHPEFVDRMLAHSYENAGNFEAAIEQWKAAIQRAETMSKDQSEREYMDRSGIDTAKTNLSRLYLRLAWRYGSMDYYRKGLELAESMLSRPNTSEVEKRAVKGAADDYARRLAANDPPKDALKPLKVDFSVKVEKVKPRYIRVHGKLNMINWDEYRGLASEGYTHAYSGNQLKNANEREMWRDGSRVFWALTDEDYKFEIPRTFSWKVDPNLTCVWDSAHVDGGSFTAKIDLTKNLDFYPLHAKRYRLILWFSPLGTGAPDFVQDRIGWDGRCLTRPNAQDWELQTWDRAFVHELFPSKEKPVDAEFAFKYRVVVKEIILTQKDLL